MATSSVCSLQHFKSQKDRDEFFERMIKPDAANLMKHDDRLTEEEAIKEAANDILNDFIKSREALLDEAILAFNKQNSGKQTKAGKPSKKTKNTQSDALIKLSLDEEIKAELNLLGDVLGDVFGSVLKATGKQYTSADLLPALSKVINLLIKKGYLSFKDVVKNTAELMRMNASTKDYVDSISPRQWKAAYNAVAEFTEGTDDESTVNSVSSDEVLSFVSSAEQESSNNDSGITIESSKAFAEKLLAGESFKTIIQARKALTSLEIEPGTPLAKQADEAIELAGVMAARKIVDKGMGKTETYDALVKLADQMPSLNVRSSTSVAQQAYSTPLPLAYVAAIRAGIDKSKTVVEPTGGNGALLITADPEKTVANELNPDRVAALKAQGFDALSHDASDFNFGNADTDAVIANPPFGVVKDENGNSKTFKITPVYSTNEIDHVIALNSLKAMANDGKAVLIVGGPSKTLSDAGRSDAYNGKAKRAFYYTLYNEYNVTDHFTVSGSLYAKQGAAWPVDVIVIEGRGKSKLALPAASVPRIINTFEELKDELQNDRSSVRQTRVSIEQAAAGSTETGDAGNVLGNAENGLDQGKSEDGQPDGVLHGHSGRDKDVRLVMGHTDVAGKGDGVRRPGGNDTSNASLTNKYQAEYTPASKANPIGSLVPVNMQNAIKEALQKIVDKHGDIDEYVANLLGYKTDELSNYFSAEQVDSIALALNNITNGKGFIIGSQTGIGKGRVNAAMIRYALKNKITPIFVTQQPNLYSDMIRDLTDIDTEVMPFATNMGNDGQIPLNAAALRWDTEAQNAKTKGEKAPPIPNDAVFAKMSDAKKRDFLQGSSLQEYDVIFTTYNQMQTIGDTRTPRQDFLEKMADGGLLILDESHNAGGTSVTQKRGKNAPDEGEKTGRAAFARKLVSLAKGVFYSSATYAKRPDVLDLYSKTDMGLVADPESLKSALVSGGVPLQQSVASMLAKAGQYIRHEKSFNGIVYDTVTVDVDRVFAEKTSEIMREIMKFDDLKAAAIKAIKDDIKGAAGTMSGDRSTGKAGADSKNFTSVMHNMIGQMLLTLKVQPTIDEALAALRRNEKPVIALSNTMGSAIEEYVADVGLNPGDAIGLSFGDILKRYANKSRRVTEGDPFGKKIVRQLTDAELGPLAVAQFKKVLKLIDTFDFNKYPVSPIDAIHAALAKEGYKSGEITGRQAIIDYSGSGESVPATLPTSFKIFSGKQYQASYLEYVKGKVDKSSSEEFKIGTGVKLELTEKTGIVVGAAKIAGKKNEEYLSIPVLIDGTEEVFPVARAFLTLTGKFKAIEKDYQTELDNYSLGSNAEKGMPIYRRRPSQQIKAAGKRKVINDFNNGLLDVIILNQSGATGLSLHASPKVGGDTRKRHMIITQAELNIDTHMQMLGRTNRTGQIVLPAYGQLTANIPAEKRIAAILANKMAMLNANTTAGKDSAVKAKDVPDFMNNYGDEVVASIMNDNRDIHKKLGKPLSPASSGEGFEVDGAMRRVTGRIPVLSLKDQEDLYQLIEDEYSEYIDMLTKTGQNQLEAQAMDLDAITMSSTVVVERTDKSDSPFAEGVTAEKVDVKLLGKPYTIDQINGLVAKQGVTDQESSSVFVRQILQASYGAHEKRMAEINIMPEDDAQDVKKKEAAKTLLDYQKDKLDSFARSYPPGQAVLLTNRNGAEYLGIVGKLERKGGAKNYFAMGQWKATIYVADAARSFTIPLSKFNPDTGWAIQRASKPVVINALTESESVTREKRYILTGNMLAAYGFDKTGQIINYTKSDGEIVQGVLMPKAFKLEKAIAAQPVVFQSPDIAIQFAQVANGTNSLRSADNEVRLIRQPQGDFVLFVPASKARGGAIFTNPRLNNVIGDFYKRGSDMSARVQRSSVADVIRILYPITGPMQPVMKEDGKKFLTENNISEPKGLYMQDDIFVETRKTKKEAFNAGYQQDLFGEPLPEARREANARSSKKRDVQPTAAIRDTGAPKGRYATRTKLLIERTRNLGSDVITNPSELAQAIHYLGASPVEYFDAIVTDAKGKPLAVVGSFKGEHAGASVYPTVVVAEAFRIEGAKHIWFAHNHPSGKAELSTADRGITKKLQAAFDGSSIQAHGIIATTTKGAWVYEDPNPSTYFFDSGKYTAANQSVPTPVVERLFDEHGVFDDDINSPDSAMRIVPSVANGESGLVLLDNQHRPVAFLPVKPDEALPLKGSGQMDRLYRALSVSNASASILYDPKGEFTSVQYRNIGTFLNGIDHRFLDVLRGEKGSITSIANQGMQLANYDGVFFSKGKAKENGFTVDQLKQALPDYLQSLLKTDSFKVITAAEAVKITRDPAARSSAGFYDTATQTTYFVADNIDDTTDLDALALHEIGVHARQLGKNDAEFKDILKQLKGLIESGNAKAVAAKNLVPKGTPKNQELEEVLAYAIQNHPTLPISQRFIAWMRNAIRNIGKLLPVLDRVGFVKWANSLSVEDMVYMAQVSLRQFRGLDSSRENKRGGSAFLYHSAFHGSPHDHNKFDSSKIGTGEGAQAFGYGLYFTDSKSIAEYYRDKLSRTSDYKFQIDSIPYEDFNFEDEYNNYVFDKLNNHWDGDIDSSITKVIESIARYSNAQAIDARKVFDKYRHRIAKYSPQGKLYQVELAPTQDEYLDWDKTLSEQSEKVKEAIFGSEYKIKFSDKAKDFGFNPLSDGMTGKDFYSQVTKDKLKGPKAASDFLHSIGIRGIRYKAEGGKSDANNYVIFSDDDISITAKYSMLPPIKNVAKQGNAWLKSSLNDTTIYNLQDRFIDLKRQIEKAVSEGGEIDEDSNPYLKEELYHQRTASRIKDFYDKEVNPLLESLHEKGVKLGEFQKLLHARHAPSRNAVMATRNPNQAIIDAKLLEAEEALAEVRDNPAATRKELSEALAEYNKWRRAKPFNGTEEARLSLSGMTNTEARAIISSADPELIRLADKIDAINNKTLDLLVQYGMETPETVKALKKQWRHYVPLHRDEAHPDENNFGHPIGRGFSVRGSGMQSATGSNAEVTNILAHIMAAREQMLKRGEKNRVSNALAEFVKLNPDNDFATVDTVEVDKVLGDDGLVRPQAEPIFKRNMADNVVMFRIEGKDHAIVFNDNKPETKRLAMSLKNLDGANLDAVESLLAKGTRWFSRVNTQYNVVFGIVNLMRDTQAMALNLTNTPLHGKQGEILMPKVLGGKHFYLADAFKAILQTERQFRNADPRLKAMYDRFNKAGGTTGYAQMFEDIKSRNQSIEKEFAKLGAGKAMKKAIAMGKVLTDFNTLMENSTRLAVFMSAVNNGLSDAQAASLAKNITVNFNRKGAQATKIGAFYAFFNASAQGTAKLVETLSGPKGREIMTGAVLLGAATTAIGLMMMGDDDWEKIPEFVRERSLILPTGSDTYISIPMPLGFHLFPNIGRKLVESAFGSNRVSLTQRFLQLSGSTVSAFNPLGGSDVSEFVMPTVLDPALALWRNKDWTGHSIYKEDFNSLKPTPGFTRTKDSATWFGKKVAEIANKATGGTDYKQGLWSPTPDQIDYVIGQIAGGSGRELLKVEQTIAGALSDEEVPLYKTPLVGRLAGKTSGNAAERNAYYENLRRLNEHEAEVKGLRKEGKLTELKTYIAENPEASLIESAGKIERAINKLNDKRKDLRRQGESTASIDMLIGAQMKRFNDQIADLQ